MKGLPIGLPSEGEKAFPAEALLGQEQGLRAGVDGEQVREETRLDVVRRRQAIRLEPLRASGGPDELGLAEGWGDGVPATGRGWGWGWGAFGLGLRAC